MSTDCDICIATYNGSCYIENQIKSILSQISDNSRIYIVDDNSADNTLQLVEKINDKRITILRNNKNIGHVKTFQKAIAMTTSNFVFLSDQDDIWAPNKVSSMISKISQNKAIKLVVSELINFKVENGETIFLNKIENPRYKNKFEFIIKQLLGKINHWGCSFLADGDFIRGIRFNDDVESHDIYIGIKAVLSNSICYISMPLVYHRLHNNNVTKKRPLVKKIKSRIKLMKILYRELKKNEV